MGNAAAVLAPLGGDKLSVLGQRWVWAEGNSRQAAALAQSTGMSPLIAQILAARGFGLAERATVFLNPRLEQLPPPFTLKDLDVAVRRLAQAIVAREVVGIFGDYDVDGTCACAILVRYLRGFGAEPIVYIPERLSEGYGPNPAAMRVLHGQGVRLLVTVDTGTTAHEALAEAQALGMEVIVTDHHQPGASLPPALAIVNPQRADCASPLQNLCASGVIFYVLMALNRHLRESGFFKERVEPSLTPLLGMVALATVADVMPLVDYNRVLVAKGLQQLATWQHRGLAALASVAGVRDDVSAIGLAFGLAPRLNAAGRVESARSAMDLLLTDDDAQALVFAQRLQELNTQRQAIEKEVLREALAQAEGQFTDATLALVLHGQGWHPGVAGIVAARVKERFNRPTFVLGVDEHGVLKGSGRSVVGLDLGAAVRACGDVLLSGGGHAMAAGITLQPANLAAFGRLLAQALAAQLAQDSTMADIPLAVRLAPQLGIAARASVANLTPDMGQALQQLGPFGNGNPEPVLALEQARIVHAKPVGATQEHLRLRLAGVGGGGVDAICFGAMNTPLGAVLGQSGGRALTLAATLRPRVFNGKALLDVQVKDAVV